MRDAGRKEIFPDIENDGYRPKAPKVVTVSEHLPAIDDGRSVKRLSESWVRRINCCSLRPQLDPFGHPIPRHPHAERPLSIAPVPAMLAVHQP